MQFQWDYMQLAATKVDTERHMNFACLIHLTFMYMLVTPPNECFESDTFLIVVL